MSHDFGPFRVTFDYGASPSRVREYRLRHQAFVDECQFEKSNAQSEGLEHDAFDDASCALLLEDRSTGEVAGCQRLVLPDQLPAGQVANVERVYRSLGGRPAVDFSPSARHTWAEASRTTVARGYRWGGATTPLPAMVAIHVSSIALALAFGRSVLFSLSELRTQRLVRRLGFPMVQVGEPVDFHGIRAPFMMKVEDMIESVPAHQRAMLDGLLLCALQVAVEARRPKPVIAPEPTAAAAPAESPCV